MNKTLIAVMLHKKNFKHEETRIKYLDKYKLKTNFRKKKAFLKGDYYLYKQKDYIKFIKTEERIVNNSIKYLFGYK